MQSRESKSGSFYKISSDLMRSVGNFLSTGEENKLARSHKAAASALNTEDNVRQRVQPLYKDITETIADLKLSIPSGTYHTIAEMGNLIKTLCRLHDDFNNNAVPAAIRANKTDLAELLLRCGASFNVTDQEGNTLLLAVKKGMTNIVRLLTTIAPTMINLGDHRGITAFMYACCSGHTEITQILLSNKATNINLEGGFDKETALMMTVAAGQTDILRMLLAHAELNIHQTNKEGETALHCAAKKNGCSEMIPLLLARGAKVDALDKWGRSPLHTSAIYSNADAAQALLEHGHANVNLKMLHDGTTPLIHASEYAHRDLVAVLLNSSKIDVNMKNNKGETALMLVLNPSYSHDREENIKATVLLLLARGANPYLKYPRYGYNSIEQTADPEKIYNVTLTAQDKKEIHDIFLDYDRQVKKQLGFCFADGTADQLPDDFKIKFNIESELAKLERERTYADLVRGLSSKQRKEGQKRESKCIQFNICFGEEEYRAGRTSERYRTIAKIHSDYIARIYDLNQGLLSIARETLALLKPIVKGPNLDEVVNTVQKLEEEYRPLSIHR